MALLMLKQIKVLLYRNFFLHVRQKSETIHMIIWPIYFVVLLAILKNAAYKPTSFPDMKNLDTASLFSYMQSTADIYVAPDSDEVTMFTNSLQEQYSNFSFTAFPDLASMDAAYKALPSEPIGIYFPNSPSIHAYALRFPYGRVPSSGLRDFSLSTCREVNISQSGYCAASEYFLTGFSAMQAVIDAAIIRTYNANFTLPDVTVQRMPKAGGVSNAEVFTILSALYLVMAMSPVLVILLVNVVGEKQRKIKEAMKIMGLDNFALWFSWSATYGIIILGITLVMALITVFGQLFPNSDFFLVFLIFFLYGLSTEMMGFMLATFFSNARTAGSAGAILNVFLGLLYLIIAFVPNLSVSAVWAINLFAPAGFATAISQIALFDVTSGGATFDNVWDGSRPIGISLVMLPVDILLYFLLTLYFDNVIPGEYGQRKPFYYFLIPSYWFPPTHVKVPATNPLYGSTDVSVNGDSEAIPDDLTGKEAIRFKNITKVYSSGNICTGTTPSTTAVNNFSLDVYEGQITALLGHNGAGKTTLFNILTGFVDTTHGRATVFNYDVSNSKQMSKIRQMTGFCPQHNILFDVLSVREHLHIFAGIKGIEDEETEAEIDRIIKLIGLEDQAATFAKKLSGGQKRKLSVGIAIMGDPKVLILDEPTAGMDPYSRHVLWDVLRARKESRVTLLTTHFMDEADILADRKAIISRGQLRCVGSSLFLKNRFGAGYHLRIVMKTAGNTGSVTEYVTSNVRGAELQRTTGYELGYTLPITEVGKFAELFHGLETRGDEMNVQSFGVSMTTLEEVFLKIGEEDEVEDQPEDSTIGLFQSNNEIVNRLKSKSLLSNAVNGDAANNVDSNSSTFNPAIGKVGKPIPSEVFFVLFKKQLLVYRRNPGAILFGLVFPLALAIGGAAVLNISATGDNQVDPPLISLTGGAHLEYEPFLYKNSTGYSLENFTTHSPALSLSLSNLTNIYQIRGVPSYLASDIYNFQENELSYKALFNTSGIHSLPTIINTMGQAFLRTVNSSASQIITYNKRWPARSIQPTFNGGSFGGVLMSAFAVIMVTGQGIILPVMERELKIRSQLRVSGVQFNLYWLSSFAADFCWYLIVLLGYFIGIAAFSVQPLIVPGAIAAQVLLFFGSGISSILATYCANFMYEKHETATGTWFNIVQMMTFIPYLIVSLIDQLNSPDVAQIINVVFLLFIPHYSGFSGLYYITKVYNKRALLGQTGAIPTYVYFDWSEPMVPLSILIAYIHIVLMFTLLKILDVLVNGGKISDIFCKMSKLDTSVSDSSVCEEELEFEDDDVQKERSLVNSILKGNSDKEPVVVVQNLRKEFVKRSGKSCFQSKKKEEKIKVAVANLSLSVCPGEVLGLLGPNGAGKTTAISMLTADYGPTRGKVFVSGHDIQSNVSEAFQEMGYCSQDNPLWEKLTLKEHLEIYATTHGVTKDTIKATIDNYIDALDIREHLDKRSQQLSGGTKRKLCFAIAMLGNPQVVLLDEPSTGMDPKTKRFMWKTISTAFEGTSRGAILTTHYMDEADALCSRVAIMVLGKLRCVGSTQHLKGKFGQGYVLEIKLKNKLEENDSSLSDLVHSIFSNVGKPEQFSHRYVYKVAQSDVISLSKVFAAMEKAKQHLGIEEYSFSQSTLEQVFLQFAREQDERQAEENLN